MHLSLAEEPQDQHSCLTRSYRSPEERSVSILRFLLASGGIGQRGRKEIGNPIIDIWTRYIEAQYISMKTVRPRPALRRKLKGSLKCPRQ